MLATLTGDLCLLVGLAVLLLPLLATELSRPRDGAWGAVVLLLGLVLVTSSDRLRGAPMLGVACAALLISRLGSEVAQGRWNQLSPDEQQRLSSRERWTTSLQQLIAALVSLGSSAGSVVSTFKPSQSTAATLPKREGSSKTGKRWVRPEAEPPTAFAGPETDSPEVKPTAPESVAETEAETQASNANAEDSNPPASKGFGATKGKGKGKRWVRPEPQGSERTPPPEHSSPSDTAAAPGQDQSAQDPEPPSPDGTVQD